MKEITTKKNKDDENTKPKQIRYIKLTEHNFHEGESWNFYIPYESDKHITKLIKTIAKKLMDDECWDIKDYDITEEEVDTICRLNDESGYMPFNNKDDVKLKKSELQNIVDCRYCLYDEKGEGFPLLEDWYKGDYSFTCGHEE